MPTPLRYEECRAPAIHAPWIACCWQIRGHAAHAATHRVLPDGCGDLVIDLAGARAGRDAVQLVGPMTRAAVFPLARALDVLGVRFRPGALGMLVRANMRDLTGIALAPADLRLALDLPLERLAATPSLRLRAARVLAALQPWLRAACRPDPAVAHVLTRWRDAPLGVPLARVAVLARDAGLGERTLERRFAAQVGYAPAEFRRLARFRRVLQQRAAGTTEWAALALDCGYADQPHLVRDFAAFAGLAPEAWAREQQAVGFLQDGQVTLD